MSFKTCLRLTNVILIIIFDFIYNTISNMIINTTHIIIYNLSFVIVLFVIFITISNTMSNMISNIQEMVDPHRYDIKIFLYDNK